jgi:cytochrome c oxidase subunit I
MVLITVTPLSAAQLMLLVDRYMGGHFFDTQAGGSATLWMHFFWIFGHPEVYILILSAFAFMSETVPVFSRKPIFGYDPPRHAGAPQDTGAKVGAPGECPRRYRIFAEN